MFGSNIATKSMLSKTEIATGCVHIARTPGLTGAQSTNTSSATCFIMPCANSRALMTTKSFVYIFSRQFMNYFLAKLAPQLLDIPKLILASCMTSRETSSVRLAQRLDGQLPSQDLPRSTPENQDQ